VIHNFSGPIILLLNYYCVQLIVISRIVRNVGHSCLRLCHIEGRKYFPPYTFKMDAPRSVKSRGLVKTNARPALY